MSNPAELHSKAEIEASEWLLAMNGRTVSLEQQSRFTAWLDADPSHKRIYHSQKDAWRMLGAMPHLLDEAFAATNSSSRPRKLQTYAALAAAFVLLLIGGVLIKEHSAWWSSQTRFETATAQVREVRLADGTVVTLGAASQIEVRFGKSARSVTLARGEAYFDVAHDATRPFLVTAGTALVRVVGTKFDVNYRPKSVRIAVEEGRVEVSSGSSRTLPPETVKQGDPQVLLPGEAALAEDSGRIATTSTPNKADLGSWRHGRFVYVDAPLRDVVADINRYYDGKIELADDSVGDLQLTSAFRADQIDKMLEVLERALPIVVTQTADQRIVLSRRSARH